MATSLHSADAYWLTPATEERNERVVYSQIQFTLKGMVISGDNDTLVYTENEGKQGATQEKEAGFQERDKDKKEIDQGNKKRKTRAAAAGRTEKQKPYMA